MSIKGYCRVPKLPDGMQYWILLASFPVLFLVLAGPTVLFSIYEKTENVEWLSQYARDAESSFRFEAAEALIRIRSNIQAPADKLDLVLENLRDNAGDPNVRGRVNIRLEKISRDYAEKKSADLLTTVIPLLRNHEYDPTLAFVPSEELKAALGAELFRKHFGQQSGTGFSEPEPVDLVLELWWDKALKPNLDLGSEWRFASRRKRPSVWHSHNQTPREIDVMFDDVDTLGVVVISPKKVGTYAKGFPGGIDSWEAVCKGIADAGAYTQVANLFVVDLSDEAIISKKLGVSGAPPPSTTTGCTDIGPAPKLEQHFQVVNQ